MKYTNIKTWEDAAKVANLDPVKSLPFPTPKNRTQEATNGFFKMSIICDVLNDGWVPNWNDWSEEKYFPSFKFSGGGFLSYDCDYAYSRTSVGACLVYKTIEIAVYAGLQFNSIYESFLTK